MDENMKLRAELRSRTKDLDKSRMAIAVKNSRRDVKIAELKIEIMKLGDNNEENKQKTKTIFSEEFLAPPVFHFAKRIERSMNS
jgi:hypothetical protein